jgi:hypothetical protein
MESSAPKIPNPLLRIRSWVRRATEERSLQRAVAECQQWQACGIVTAPRTLHELCDRWGSDKGSINLEGPHPYPWPPHTYADFYSQLFEHCRMSVKLVFECGLGTTSAAYANNMGARGRPGASLRVWRDWFPNAQIFGADIDRAVLFEEDRIKTYFVDQTDQIAIASMWGEIGQTGFDVMIDDGWHAFHAGISLFEGSLSYLRSGGVYIIEDVSMSDIVKYRDHFQHSQHWVEIHTLQRHSRRPFDNNLVVIRRR